MQTCYRGKTLGHGKILSPYTQRLRLVGTTKALFWEWWSACRPCPGHSERTQQVYKAGVGDMKACRVLLEGGETQNKLKEPRILERKPGEEKGTDRGSGATQE